MTRILGVIGPWQIIIVLAFMGLICFVLYCLFKPHHIMKYCPKCGNAVPDNASFCPKCGTNIPDTDSGATPAQDPTPAPQTFTPQQPPMEPMPSDLPRPVHHRDRSLLPSFRNRRHCQIQQRFQGICSRELRQGKGCEQAGQDLEHNRTVLRPVLDNPLHHPAGLRIHGRPR